jgi:hypothetical protein
MREELEDDIPAHVSTYKIFLHDPCRESWVVRVEACLDIAEGAVEDCRAVGSGPSCQIDLQSKFESPHSLVFIPLHRLRIPQTKDAVGYLDIPQIRTHQNIP